MLKFFRRLRRKLIDEGNLKRYLIYAIGEILLVMVGILLAIQINNFNIRENGSLRNVDRFLDSYNGQQSKLDKENIDLLKSYKFENIIEDHLFTLNLSRLQYVEARTVIDKILQESKLKQFE